MADKGKPLPESISSIEKCLKIIGDLRKEAGSSKQIFYRGHGKVGWDLAPSLFREDIDSSQEKRILQEMTSRKSLDFSNDQNMFEHLVRAQHYGLPTRLLDVTLSPLVALFFACSSDEEEDGELITITSKKSEIKYYDSHTVSCLANLASINLPKFEKQLLQNLLMYIKALKESDILNLIPLPPKEEPLFRIKMDIDIPDKYHYAVDNLFRKNFKILINFDFECFLKTHTLKLIKKHLDEISDIKKEYQEEFAACTDTDEYDATRSEHDQRISFLQDSFQDKCCEFGNSILRHRETIKHLYSSILEERSGFQNLLQLEDLFKTLLVFPKQSNERIVAQQGAFLLFGLNEKLKKEDEDSFGIQRYLIPQEAKPLILEQLDWLGINESFIYPELEKLSGHLLKEIKRKKEA